MNFEDRANYFSNLTTATAVRGMELSGSTSLNPSSSSIHQNVGNAYLMGVCDAYEKMLAHVEEDQDLTRDDALALLHLRIVEARELLSEKYGTKTRIDERFFTDRYIREDKEIFQ